MGNKWLKKKEESQFYMLTKNFNNYICGQPKKISDSQIKIPINHNGIEIELLIKNYEYGIIQIIFDYPDKKIRYKPKTDIPNNSLKEKPFKTINISEEKIECEIITNEYNSNQKNTLIINLQNFTLTYFLNEIKLFSLNEEKTLNCLNIETKTEKIKSNSFDFKYENTNFLIGLSERDSHLFLKDDSYRIFNVDNSDQIIGSSDPTYGSIPLIHGINKNNIISILNNNTSDQWVDIKTINNNIKNINWITEGGIIDLFLFSDLNYYNQLNKVSKITGFSKLVPLYVFGYHQCKWGYKDLNDMENVTLKFNELNIPYDVIWFDIDHTNEKKYFTWDPKNFSQPENLLNRIKDEKRYFVTIIDPHIKKCDNYEIADILKKNDCFADIKNKENKLDDYIGYSWSIFSYYIDALNYEKLQKIYKDFFKREDYFFNYDNLGIWVDINESSTFNKEIENTIPKNPIHYDRENYIEHREINNLYGYLYQKKAYNSLKNRFNNKKRPFLLTRSFYLVKKIVLFGQEIIKQIKIFK